MLVQYDQTNLKKYVNLNKMSLLLSGMSEEDEILRFINKSFTEESVKKLKDLGLIEGQYDLDELEAALCDIKILTLKEQLSEPQRSEEQFQHYLKRLKQLLPLLEEVEEPSVTEFLEIFETGIHPNVKETTRTTISEQVRRISRKSLKEAISQLEDSFKFIVYDTTKPKNTCFCCKSKLIKEPLDLEDLEEACDNI